MAKRIGKRRIVVSGAVLLAGTTHGPTARKWMDSEYIKENIRTAPRQLSCDPGYRRRSGCP